MGVDLRNGHYPETQRGAAFEEILDRLRALPGVRAASSSSQTPIDNRLLVSHLQIEGYVPKARKTRWCTLTM
jgi:hypothetical protein